MRRRKESDAEKQNTQNEDPSRRRVGKDLLSWCFPSLPTGDLLLLYPRQPTTRAVMLGRSALSFQL